MASKVKNGKIKIAMIANNLDINGISSVIMNYCRGLSQDEFDINIIAGAPINSIHRKEAEKNGIEIYELPSRKKQSCKYYIELNKILKNGKFDIVEVHGNSATITIELFIAWINKIKIRIAHSHNSTCTNKKLHKMLYPVFNRLYTHGFACSKMAGEWLFHDKPFVVIPNGFVTEKFKYNPNDRRYIRKKLGLKEDDFLIGHVGRFNYQKNQEFLLEVFKEIVEKKNNSWLVLVGTGPDFEKIQKLIEVHPYRERIIVYGETNETEKIYSSMDVFVFPSRYEGLGMVAVEAQISGLPCIVSDVVPKDIIVGNEVRFVSLQENCAKWAEIICKCQKDNDARTEFFEKNEKLIYGYDIQKGIQKLEKIYFEELKGEI